MARDFPDAADGGHYLSNAAAVVTAVPLTLACWFNADDITNYHILLGVFDSTSTFEGENSFYLSASGAADGDPVQAITAAGGVYGLASTSTGYAAGAWHHACGVFTSTDLRAAYIDGSNKGDDVTSLEPLNTPDRTFLGRFSAINGADARVAEAAVWDATLSDAEVASLARGLSPLLVRPQSLAAYWPLIGRYSPEIDLLGGFPLTVNGTVTTADHCRIVYPPSRPSRRFATTAAFDVTTFPFPQPPRLDRPRWEAVAY